MTRRLSVCVALFLSLVSVAAAQVDPTLLPRNVLVTNMAPGDRGQVSLVLEWDEPMRLVTSVTSDKLIYQIFSKCAFDVAAPNENRGGSAGTTLVRGPGPHFRVVARECNCTRQQVSLAVRVYEPKAQATREAVYAQTVPPGGNSIKVTWLHADCGK